MSVNTNSHSSTQANEHHYAWASRSYNAESALQDSVRAAVDNISSRQNLVAITQQLTLFLAQIGEDHSAQHMKEMQAISDKQSAETDTGKKSNLTTEMQLAQTTYNQDSQLFSSITDSTNNSAQNGSAGIQQSEANANVAGSTLQMLLSIWR